MIGTIIGLILLVALLGVMFYCARMLLPLIPSSQAGGAVALSEQLRQPREC